jgi:hypothetical protein
MAGRRAIASLAAALAVAAAADGSAMLLNKLLTDGAAMAAAWVVVRLAARTAQGLRRAARTAFTA